MNRTLLIGADGMLARAFRAALPDMVAYRHQEMDLLDAAGMAKILRTQSPEIVINCAAYTNVTKAEQDPTAALAINGGGVGNLARICREIGAKLVHYSTDFVFPGRLEGNYREDEPTHPVNRYGATKLEGERQILDLLDNALILRVSWLYGPGGKNFVSTIGDLLRQKEEVRIVADQLNKTTYTPDVVVATLKLLELNVAGIVHFANAGVLSRYDFTVEIARYLNEREPLSCQIVPIPASEYPDPTPRPVNSAMNCEYYERLTGTRIPDWKDALRRMMTP